MAMEKMLQTTLKESGKQDLTKLYDHLPPIS